MPLAAPGAVPGAYSNSQSFSRPATAPTASMPSHPLAQMAQMGFPPMPSLPYTQPNSYPAQPSVVRTQPPEPSVGTNVDLQAARPGPQTLKLLRSRHITPATAQKGNPRQQDQMQPFIQMYQQSMSNPNNSMGEIASSTASMLAAPLNDDDVRIVFERLDSDGNGVVSFQEFFSFLKELGRKDERLVTRLRRASTQETRNRTPVSATAGSARAPPAASAPSDLAQFFQRR
eukprot:NODE_3605_length_947_cov_20.534521_g3312_i0.p1 GENE.NODE_3605_length_947_cov_20.534521_g3312_i0~~NODE_3605_length_947_cov_20.534521_g3312_i0.p1  ORF type:complete len:265 (-),score=19.64 NODE_3605_length_947_cov_20.534521_g3312_i0:151-840(-)